MEETCKPLFSFGVIADVQYGDKDDNREFFIPSHCIDLIRKIESKGGFDFFFGLPQISCFWICELHSLHTILLLGPGSFFIACNFIGGA
jgi:hypothetical protein